jgi:hypothetical protein
MPCCTAARPSTGAIALELDDTYGQWNVLRHTGKGLIR